MPRQVRLSENQESSRLRFSKDGQWIYACASSGFYVLSSTTLEIEGNVAWKKDQKVGSFQHFDISPDEKFAVMGSKWCGPPRLISLVDFNEHVFDHVGDVSKAFFDRRSGGKYLITLSNNVIKKWNIAQQGKCEATTEQISFASHDPFDKLDRSTLQENQSVDEEIKDIAMSNSGAFLVVQFSRTIKTKRDKGGTSIDERQMHIFYDLSVPLGEKVSMIAKDFKQPQRGVRDPKLGEKVLMHCEHYIFTPDDSEIINENWNGYRFTNTTSGNVRMHNARLDQFIKGPQGISFATDPEAQGMVAFLEEAEQQNTHKVVLADLKNTNDKIASATGLEIEGLREFRQEDRTFSVALSPDGKSFAVSTLKEVKLIVLEAKTGGGASPARNSALANRAVTAGTIAETLESYISDILTAEAQKLWDAASSQNSTTLSNQNNSSIESEELAAIGCRDLNDQEMLANPLSVKNGKAPVAAPTQQNNSNEVGYLPRWFAWELPKTVKATLNINYHHKQQRLVLLKCIEVLKDTIQELKRSVDLPLWCEGLCSVGGAEKIGDLFFAIFLYTVNSVECNCTDPTSCQKLVAEEYQCQKRGKKWENAAGKASHCKPDPAVPGNTAAFGWNIFSWAVMNWSLRVSCDSPDPSVKSQSLKAAEVMRPFQIALSAALQALPTTSATVFRGIKCKVQHAYRPGDQVCWPAFSSTSTQGEVAKVFMGKDQGTFFIINTHSAASIKFASWYPTQDELLIACNAQFEVQRRFSNTLLTMLHSNAEIIVMRELGGPGHNAKRAADLVVEASRRTQFIYSSFLEKYVEAKLSRNRGATSANDAIAMNAQCKQLVKDAESGVDKCKKMVIVGEGGTGKTSSLLATASYLISATDDATQNVFPVFIPLPNVDFNKKGGIDEAVLRELRITEDGVRCLGRNPRKLVLLLDSLDEVGSLSEAKQAHHILDRNPLVNEAAAVVVLSTRSEVLDRLNLDPRNILSSAASTNASPTQVRYVQPFTDRDMEIFLTTAACGIEEGNKIANGSTFRPPPIPDAAKELCTVIKEKLNLWETLRNPYLLSIATDVLAEKPHLIDEAHAEITMGHPDHADGTRYGLWELYEAFARKFCEDRLELAGVTDASARSKRAVRAVEQAQAMAVAMLSDNALQAPQHKYAGSVDDFSALPLRVENAFGDAGSVDKSRTFCFRHKSLHEFFVARDIYRSIGSVLTDDLQPHTGSTLNTLPNLASTMPISINFFAARLQRDLTLHHCWRAALKAIVNAKDQEGTKVARSNVFSIMAASNIPLDSVGSLEGKVVANADLNGAILMNANLKNAKLHDCNLCHTVWSGSNLTNLDAKGSFTLSQGRLTLTPCTTKSKSSWGGYVHAAEIPNTDRKLFVFNRQFYFIVDAAKEMKIVKQVERPAETREHNSNCSRIEMANNGKFALFHYDREAVIVVNLSDLSERYVNIEENTQAVTKAKLSADSKFVLVGTEEAVVQWYDVNSLTPIGGKKLDIVQHSSHEAQPTNLGPDESNRPYISDIIISPVGDRFMIAWGYDYQKKNPNGGASGRNSRVWDTYDTNTLKLIPNTREKMDHGGGEAKNHYEEDSLFTKDGKFIICRGQHNVRKRIPLNQYLDSAFQQGGNFFALSSSGSSIILRQQMNTIVVIDTTSMAPTTTIPKHLHIDDAVLLDGGSEDYLITTNGKENCLEKSLTTAIEPRQQPDWLTTSSYVKSLSQCNSALNSTILMQTRFQQKQTSSELFSIFSHLHFNLAGHINKDIHKWGTEMNVAESSGKLVTSRLENKELKINVSKLEDKRTWVNITRPREYEPVDAQLTLNDFNLGDRGISYFATASDVHGGAAVLGFEKGVVILDIKDDTPKLVALIENKSHMDATFSPNGKWVALHMSNNRLRVVTLPQAGGPAALKALFSASVDQLSKEALATYEVEGRSPVRFSADSATLLVGVKTTVHNPTLTDDGWGSAKQQTIQFKNGEVGGGGQVNYKRSSISDDGSVIAVAHHEDATLSFCARMGEGNETSFEEIASVRAETKKLRNVHYDSASNLFVTTGEDDSVRWWEAVPNTFVTPVPLQVPPFAQKALKAFTATTQSGNAGKLAGTSANMNPRLVAQFGPRTAGFVSNNPDGSESITNNESLRLAITTT